MRPAMLVIIRVLALSGGVSALVYPLKCYDELETAPSPVGPS